MTDSSQVDLDALEQRREGVEGWEETPFPETIAKLIAELRAARAVVEAARALFGIIAPIEYDLGGNRLLIDLRAALADYDRLTKEVKGNG